MLSRQQSPANNNNNIQPVENQPVPADLTDLINGIVALQLQQCLWYQVQCVSADQAADALHVETDTVRQWIKAGKLPASKIGKDWTIRLVDIDKMLKLNATVVRIMPDRRRKQYKIKAC